MGMGISEQEWRADVTRRVDDTERNQQQAAIILERLTNRLDEHDRRLTALEQAPETRERKVVALGGLTTNVVYVLLLVGSLLLSASAHISFH
ncbi:MAG TPA: hypothetical protein VFN78_02560 [Ktedonobacterales bacterium]|nr:hypothetical protein [Ktedonobacterales bacterium]